MFEPPNSRVLQLASKDVPIGEIQSDSIQLLIDRMLYIANGNQGSGKTPTMVGLAAPQIGVSRRVVIVGINATGSGEKPLLKEFINPKILELSKEYEEDREGCFSTGRVCGVVSRPKKVLVAALNRGGSSFQLELEGFPARVMQHEIDHLDGIRFPDKITDDSKLHWVEEHEFGVYRKKWNNWPVLCPRKRWERIKSA